MIRLQVQQGIAGRGVFTLEPVSAGSHLLHFTGPLLRYAQTSPATLAVQIGPDLYLGGSGGLDDFVNHCCDPNAGLIIRAAGDASGSIDVNLIALRDIAVGEEIFFDYSTSLDEDDFEFDCRCRSPHCRGRIGDFKKLPLALRQKYAAMGIVPEYNLKYLAPEQGPKDRTKGGGDCV